MLLTLTLAGTPAAPARDLGHLLHKHPDRVQAFDVGVGRAQVLYPEASAERCTVALLLEVDPVGLVRDRRSRPTSASGPDAGSLAEYVNDRPYAASSLLAVALGRVFRTAMAGRCDARPDLAMTDLPLEVHVPALPCRGGAAFAERVFAPLGWTVTAAPVPLDPAFPAWGDSRYLDLRLSGSLRVADALNQLYVLLPVLDDAKHYWVSPDEVDKLVRAGGSWLAAHPEQVEIVRRYLAHQRSLVLTATGRLAEADDAVPEALDDAVPDAPPQDDGAPAAAPLAQQRIADVLAVLHGAGATRVVDLGCGEGALVRALVADPAVTEVLAADPSPRALELAERRLRREGLPERRRDVARFVQSAATYRDERLRGFDAVVLVEVVEHVDPPRLPDLERNVFGDARPRLVVVTTPNAEHNVRFPGLPEGQYRHRDHRFEWTRAAFVAWAERVAGAHGYAVRFLPVGLDDPEVGPPTQLAAFNRLDADREAGAA